MDLRTFLAAVAVGLALGLAACGDVDDTGDDDDDSGSSLTGACELYEDNSGCPECADGDVTCTYGEVSVTEMSCGGCQAEASLYKELCDAGVTDSAADIQAGMECALASASAACDLAREWSACDECYDGDVTCTFEEYSETAGSCGDCQARGQLYAALCEAVVTADRETIESGTTCTDPV